ncbi:MAG: major facilitator transporter [Chloroflexi bacterium OLB14]|nr:MAG: major facilitator transporter [Chloroflexi bacterium OLB14]
MLPLLPFFVQAQDGGALIAGLLSSFYAFTQLFTGPIIGSLSDRFGRRPVLLICLCGTALGYLILGFANSLPLLFLAVLIDGLTGGNLTTVYAYIADVTNSENRARGMSLVGAAFGLGLMAGPALGGFLSQYGLYVPAFVACAIALANIIFGFFVLPESLPLEKRATKSIAESFNWMKQFIGLFQQLDIQKLLIAMFLLNLAFAGLQSNFPLYSNFRFQWNPTQNGYFYLYVGVCAVFIQGFLFGKLQPRFGEKRLTIFGLSLMAIGLAGMAFAPQAWMLFPAVTIVALGTGTSIPSLTALVSLRVAENEQGRLMGGTQTLLALTNIFGPIIAGISFELITFSAPYWLGSLFAIFALIVARSASHHTE